MKENLLLELRKGLKKFADPKKAPQMQAYMKSKMPYHGVQSPLAKRVYKEVFSEIQFSKFTEWETQVIKIWEGAQFREERYGALALAAHRSAKDFQTPKAMKLYERLIVSGAWWDYVDDIAIHRVGAILVSHPIPLKKQMLRWSKSNDIWKRRTAIICQIGAGDALDLKLLYACIEPSMGSDEFFLRKGIGWALRQVAWSDPKEVIRYVERNQDRLSGLSKREALKNVLRNSR